MLQPLILVVKAHKHDPSPEGNGAKWTHERGIHTDRPLGDGLVAGYVQCC